MSILKSRILVLFFFFFLKISGQEIEYIEQFPDEDVITLSLEKHLNIKVVQGKLKITQAVNKRNLFLTTNSLRHSEEEVSYNTFNTIKELKASTEHSINGNQKKYPVSHFEDKDVVINSVFFNDQKEKKIIFPNVAKNAITNLDYTLDINDPHFIPPSIFWSEVPIVQSKISVSFPSNVKVSFKELHLDTVIWNFEKTIKESMITYTWILKNIPKTSRHYDFSPLYYIPQIIIYIDSFTHKDKTVSVLKNTEDLYKWYVSLISNLDDNQGQLKSIAVNLIENAESEEEKIKNIYYFVQDKINYIAFEDGLNGFIPRNAYDVYSKKYGDCKDMANILHQLFSYVGIDSYLTWIGTRKKPYSYDEVPTPVVDNHMITTVITKAKDTLFLDATAKYLPYGYASPFIQGKEALIGISPSTYEIKKVPAISVQKNRLDIKSEFTLVNNTLVGTHNASILGHEKLGIMHRIENKDIEDLDFLHRNLNLGLKQTSFENIVYKNLERKKDTLKISFNSETSNYSRKIGEKIYVKPHFDTFYMDKFVRDEAKAFDKEIDYKSTKTFRTLLKIPEDYEVDFIPENANFEDDKFHFKITFKQVDNQIIIAKQLIIDTLKIEAKRIDIWNNFIRSLSKANKQTIVLRRKK